MYKKIIITLLVLTAFMGHLSAQSISNAVVSSSLPGLESGLRLDLLQGGGYDWRNNPDYLRSSGASKAGLLNMVFGLWSWQNGDIFGGALTAGLEGGGLLLSIIGLILMGDADIAISVSYAMTMIGVGIFGGGMVFGYFRGSDQFKKQFDANTTAWTGNPINHVYFNLVPGVNGKNFNGQLGFAASY